MRDREGRKATEERHNYTNSMEPYSCFWMGNYRYVMREGVRCMV